MTTLLQTFDAMPPADREEIFRLLRIAMMHRGAAPMTGPSGSLSALSLAARIQEIADIFARNGHELEEYT